ncbi:S8 family serine peptidase [Vitiosangium sp. GDMCC 1.1324]|uniref:S53 family peptidase n=1 Tax=Vitiosangium sp. (strain GDMCC 1.1324) TaxID=2138576 RepID=UPI00130D90C7|nr:S53 family peptidase [Vitiosangium sp. GDMCC 1.1324]
MSPDIVVHLIFFFDPSANWHAAFAAIARQYDLITEQMLAKAGLVSVKTTAKNVEKLFGVGLTQYSLKNRTFYASDGTPHVPQELSGVLVQVLGLHTIPVIKPVPLSQMVAPLARPRLEALRTVAPPFNTAYTAKQLRTLYNFPSSATGQGQKAAIIICGGGFSQSLLEGYFTSLGVGASQPQVVPVNVLNRPAIFSSCQNLLKELYTQFGVPEPLLGPPAPPGGPTGGGGAPQPPPPSPGQQVPVSVEDIRWTIEALMDVEILAGAAPDAELKVYVCDGSSLGAVLALMQAFLDGASVISCSWGEQEGAGFTSGERLTADNLLAYAGQNGCTTVVASGNQGAQYIQYPASSPFVLSVGGTYIENATFPAINTEVVWNQQVSASSGGFSTFYARPGWQQGIGFSSVNNMRGVPDVSANASGQSGYWLFLGNGSGQGLNIAGCGTSAAVPLWAALILVLNQALGRRLGFINPQLYSHASQCFNDITSGNSQIGGQVTIYQAALGWDPCTGLGTPHGQHLLDMFRGTA